MTSTHTPEATTRLLQRIAEGDPEASDKLLERLYGELRRLARAQMARESPGHTLQPTALVHEVYLRLLQDEAVAWQNRAHFFGAAAQAMRRILIERARRVARLRHGGHQRRVELDSNLPDVEEAPETLLHLNEALTRLEAQDPRMAEVVKLRYFAGLTVVETAACLDTSTRSVNRLWTAARAWLRRELERL